MGGILFSNDTYIEEIKLEELSIDCARFNYYAFGQTFQNNN
jgi:hypothetical protein